MEIEHHNRSRFPLNGVKCTMHPDTLYSACKGYNMKEDVGMWLKRIIIR
jgi:hypothetical protein